MHKSLIAAATCLALVASGMTTSASAQHRDHRQQDRFIGSFCARHPGARDCTDWQRNRHSWDDRRYHRWYEHNERDFGDVAAAMIFGMAAEAIGHAMSSGTHVQACKARYRSYDPASDTYLGYDGFRHYCKL